MVQDVIQLINVCPTSINTSPLALNNIWITVHNIQNWYLHPFLLTQCWMFAEKPQKINQGSSCDLFVNSFNNIKKRTNGKSTGGGCSSGGGGLGGGVPPLLPAPEINPPFFTSDDFWKKNCFGIKVDSLQTPMFWLKSAAVSRFIPWLPLWSFDLHGMTQQYPSGQKSVWGTVDCQTKL